METIRLKAVPVDLQSGRATIPTGGWHLYISYINRNGTERILEGGPDRVFIQPGAVLKKQPEKTYNTRLDGEYRPEDPTVVIATGTDLSRTYQALRQQMDLMTKARLPYRAQDQNSNSMVATALRNVGLPLILPQDKGRSLWLPGTETQVLGRDGLPLVPDVNGRFPDASERRQSPTSERDSNRMGPSPYVKEHNKQSGLPATPEPIPQVADFEVLQPSLVAIVERVQRDGIGAFESAIHDCAAQDADFCRFLVEGDAENLLTQLYSALHEQVQSGSSPQREPEWELGG